MEDVSQKMLERIAKIMSQDKTFNFDDQDMLDLVYKEIDDMYEKGVISEEVVKRMKLLPTNKIVLAHEELIEMTSENNSSKEVVIESETSKGKLFFIFIALLLIVIIFLYHLK